MAAEATSQSEGAIPLVPALASGEIHREEIVVKHSRFIVTLARVSDPESAKAFIARIREEHRTATHNCWAYVAGPAGDSAFVGSSDDGEPQGTAGRPMLTTLLYSGGGEIVAVVTRYFGGKLLGTGGLVRAYQGAVKAGLETLPTKPMETGVRVLVSVGPEWISAVEHQVHVAGGRVVSTDFRYDASFELSIPEENVEAFETKLTDLTSGDALVERLDEE